MNSPIINCSGFYFHCPKDRSYVVFAPQSQEENDRLDVLLGATPLMQARIEELRKEIDRLDKDTICPFTAMHPVGWPDTGDAIAVVLSGTIGKYRGGKNFGKCRWYAVRLSSESGEAELKKDLQEEVEECARAAEAAVRS
jgi:hypothetical protein